MSPVLGEKGNLELRCVLATRTVKDEKISSDQTEIIGHPVACAGEASHGQLVCPPGSTQGPKATGSVCGCRAAATQDTTPGHRRQEKSAAMGRRGPGPVGGSGQARPAGHSRLRPRTGAAGPPRAQRPGSGRRSRGRAGPSAPVFKPFLNIFLVKFK